MKKGDWLAIVIIGAAVGLLSQPILATVSGAFGMVLTFKLRLAIFIAFVILAPLALFIVYLFGKLAPVIYQFGKFAAVGVLNTFVDVGVLNLEILAFGTPSGWTYSLFKTVSFLASTTNSFLWNKYWAFNSQEPANTRETLKFYGVALIGLILNVALASYVFSSIGRPVTIAPNLWANIGALVGVAAAFIWDFIGYKYFVFKKSAERA